MSWLLEYVFCLPIVISLCSCVKFLSFGVLIFLIATVNTPHPWRFLSLTYFSILLLFHLCADLTSDTLFLSLIGLKERRCQVANTTRCLLYWILYFDSKHALGPYLFSNFNHCCDVYVTAVCISLVSGEVSCVLRVVLLLHFILHVIN